MKSAKLTFKGTSCAQSPGNPSLGIEPVLPRQRPPDQLRRREPRVSLALMEATYPTPVVRLTFSRSVSCLTNISALLYASAHSFDGDSQGDGYLGDEVGSPSFIGETWKEEQKLTKVQSSRSN